MANTQKGEVALVVDGRTYTLVLDIDAMCALEEHFSTPDHEATWDEIESKVRKGASVRLLRALIWAMLQRHHSEIDLISAGHLVNEAGGLPGLIGTLQKAMAAAAPDPSDLKELGVGKGNPPIAQAARKSRAVHTSGEGSTLMPVDAA